ncbi:hypothetical protein, partial [Leuconostoc falkenbergense]|uniref:hypothetical protein n=1 Tax=Leuconostoc falkenbergense TaxID=2766470 RepID=UPI0039E907F8
SSRQLGSGIRVILRVMMIIKTKKKTISKSEIVFFDDINNHKNTKPDELTRSSGNIFERIFEREENMNYLESRGERDFGSFLPWVSCF